ncbi:MAG TPA: hypothetical protein VE505_15200 [Vicinamibacterales bacterium]|nr:hypothetical protein [Vicinamibacterales bacterium]
MLRPNGEFFVANRAFPIDVLLLTGALSVALPAILCIIVGAVARASTTAGRILHLALVGALVGVLTSPVLAALSSVGLATHVTAAVAGALLSVWTGHDRRCADAAGHAMHRAGGRQRGRSRALTRDLHDVPGRPHREKEA